MPKNLKRLYKQLENYFGDHIKHPLPESKMINSDKQDRRRIHLAIPGPHALHRI